jgi:hypothetical protein
MSPQLFDLLVLLPESKLDEFIRRLPRSAAEAIADHGEPSEPALQAIAEAVWECLETGKKKPKHRRSG